MSSPIDTSSPVKDALILALCVINTLFLALLFTAGAEPYRLEEQPAQVISLPVASPATSDSDVLNSTLADDDDTDSRELSPSVVAPAADASIALINQTNTPYIPTWAVGSPRAVAAASGLFVLSLESSGSETSIHPIYFKPYGGTSWQKVSSISGISMGVLLLDRQGRLHIVGDGPDKNTDGSICRPGGNLRHFSADLNTWSGGDLAFVFVEEDPVRISRQVWGERAGDHICIQRLGGAVSPKENAFYITMYKLGDPSSMLILTRYDLDTNTWGRAIAPPTGAEFAVADCPAGPSTCSDFPAYSVPIIKNNPLDGTNQIFVIYTIERVGRKLDGVPLRVNKQVELIVSSDQGKTWIRRILCQVTAPNLYNLGANKGCHSQDLLNDNGNIVALFAGGAGAISNFGALQKNGYYIADQSSQWKPQFVADSLTGAKPDRYGASLLRYRGNLIVIGSKQKTDVHSAGIWRSADRGLTWEYIELKTNAVDEALINSVGKLNRPQIIKPAASGISYTQLYSSSITGIVSSVTPWSKDDKIKRRTALLSFDINLDYVTKAAPSGDVRIRRVGSDGTAYSVPAGTRAWLDDSQSDGLVENPATYIARVVGSSHIAYASHVDGFIVSAGVCEYLIGYNCSVSDFTEKVSCAKEWCRLERDLVVKARVGLKVVFKYVSESGISLPPVQAPVPSIQSFQSVEVHRRLAASLIELQGILEALASQIEELSR